MLKVKLRLESDASSVDSDADVGNPAEVTDLLQQP